jgi:hypothetical protein
LAVKDDLVIVKAHGAIVRRAARLPGESSSCPVDTVDCWCRSIRSCSVLGKRAIQAGARTSGQSLANSLPNTSQQQDPIRATGTKNLRVRRPALRC